MKFITRFLCVPVAGLLALTSCAKDEDESYVQFENQALEAWMTQHRPDLVKNYQPDGGYYIDVLDAGSRIKIRSTRSRSGCRSTSRGAIWPAILSSHAVHPTPS
ncbi:MAG: hypothetical protein ACLRMJ_08860 [Alistipes finegoldii]